MFGMNKIIMSGIVAGLLVAGLFTVAQAAVPARPGTLNYVEGNVSLDGSELSGKSIGSAELTTGQVLETGQGKAEVLLTPGVFLRLGDNSSVRMVSPQLTSTTVALLKGRALLEADDLKKQNDITVQESGAATHIAKNGIYEFNADSQSVAVYDGKAEVAGDDGVRVMLKKGRETSLSSGLKVEKFDRKKDQDDLYRWSNLRSQYLAESSAQAARTVYVNGGWAGPGWYWDPGYFGYTYLPGSGFLYSPFGYSFWSPGAIYAPAYVYPRYYGGRRGVFGGHHRFPHTPHAGGTFHGRGLHGGGFHAHARGGGHR